MRSMLSYSHFLLPSRLAHICPVLPETKSLTSVRKGFGYSHDLNMPLDSS